MKKIGRKGEKNWIKHKCIAQWQKKYTQLKILHLASSSIEKNIHIWMRVVFLFPLNLLLFANCVYLCTWLIVLLIKFVAGATRSSLFPTKRGNDWKSGRIQQHFFLSNSKLIKHQIDTWTNANTTFCIKIDQLCVVSS